MTSPGTKRQPARAVRRWAARLLVSALVCVACGTGWAETAPSKEYQVKAAFLLRFLQFVDWPERSFAAPDSPIRIGILGEDPFGAALDRMVASERIHSRPLAVERSGSAMELGDCHMIFVAGSERDRLDTVTAQLPPDAVLTISDIDGFAERGGMIRFFLADKKVRFEVNPGVAQRQHLKLSAQLLSLGKIVGSADPAKEP
jgi:hypothetical protein